MKARLRGYALWQIRDFMFERAAAILVVLVLLIWAMYEQTEVARTSVFVSRGIHAREFGASVMATVISPSWFICALTAVYGLSSNDRTNGRFRLIFAKPVNVLSYYGQAFVLHGAMFVLCAALALAVFTRLFPVTGNTVTGGLALFVLGYVLVGGVCFLFSAIWRFDWLSTGALFGIVTYFASIHPGARWLYPFPPFWIIAEQVTVLDKMRPLESKPLLWVGAYGVACFLLGLIILKRRPLAT